MRGEKHSKPEEPVYLKGAGLEQQVKLLKQQLEAQREQIMVL